MKWRDVLTGLDTRPFNGPVCLCFDQVLAAADEGDFLLMAALANLGRDLAEACGDPVAESTFRVHLGLALKALGDATAAQDLLARAVNTLRRFPSPTARQNEAIAALFLGILLESESDEKHRSAFAGKDEMRALAWYSNALSLLRKACRAHAERGDRGAHLAAAEMCRWVEKRIDNLVPCVYVDGHVESRGACSIDSAGGTNGTRPASTLSDESAIWGLQTSCVTSER